MVFLVLVAQASSLLELSGNFDFLQARSLILKRIVGSGQCRVVTFPSSQPIYGFTGSQKTTDHLKQQQMSLSGSEGDADYDSDFDREWDEGFDDGFDGEASAGGPSGHQAPEMKPVVEQEPEPRSEVKICFYGETGGEDEETLTMNATGLRAWKSVGTVMLPRSWKETAVRMRDLLDMAGDACAREPPPTVADAIKLGALMRRAGGERHALAAQIAKWVSDAFSDAAPAGQQLCQGGQTDPSAELSTWPFNWLESLSGKRNRKKVIPAAQLSPWGTGLFAD